MSCMKCGNHTEDGQVFCAHCREGMEAYPVKPDVHIQLPVRVVEATLKKQPRKWRNREKDAQITNLRQQIRWMWVVIIALALALAVLLGRGAELSKHGEIGKNYTYSEPAT